MIVFVYKKKTAYERRISDLSSDVCSSDLSIVSSRGRSAGRQRLAVAIMNRLPAATAAKVRMETLPARLMGEDQRLVALAIAPFVAPFEHLQRHRKHLAPRRREAVEIAVGALDRKSTRLNSSH